MNVATTNPTEIMHPKQIEVPVNLMQPWSTPVMGTRLTDEILGEMLKLTDKAVSNELPHARSWGHELAGEIEKETLIPTEALSPLAVSFFKGITKEYVMRCKSQMEPMGGNRVRNLNWQTAIGRMWCVSQFPGEYNPVHVHTDCTVSAVMYLKVPRMMPGLKERAVELDGSINFIGNASRDTRLSNATLTLRPVVGDLYLFAANQMHTVYPFRCALDQRETERRSVSFNAEVKILSKDNS